MKIRYHEATWKKVEVTLNTADAKEEQVIEAVKKATCDSSVKNGNKVIKSPETNVFVLETDYYFYFVRTEDFRTFEIFMNDFGSGWGFVYDKRTEIIRTHIENYNMIIFWKIDKRSRKRISSYKVIDCDRD